MSQEEGGRIINSGGELPVIIQPMTDKAGYERQGGDPALHHGKNTHTLARESDRNDNASHREMELGGAQRLP